MAETPLDIARRVVADEAEGLRLLASCLDDDFDAIIERLKSSSQVIVSGLGKSGQIAQKIAATLTSTGTPAVYMHPVEALHGDLGIVTEQHCLIALSRSGNTDEVLRFVAHFRRLGGPVIAIVQGRESRLAELCRQVILLPDVPEAGPLNLAPTTSCVMMLAVGDALAMALLHARGFAREDFAQYHPEGALGRRLLLRAEDLMHTGDELPLVRADDSFDHLIVEMTRKQLGLAVVVERDGALVGTFTDGDLRRVFERVKDPRRLEARAAHTCSRRSTLAPAVPISTVKASHPAVECLRIMRDSQITSLVVADDDDKPIGLLRLMDLLRAGLG
ncbi:MAG TPA: KpsF/GutQ family sugar-phosphate isomerase [Phycisphaerae bacterium]|nr:KpsF/GutQ family sugar-phosphate isomerase [Phycisphaerae bacterium]